MPSEEDIDITQDLVDGTDGARGDTVPLNGGNGTEQVVPDGTVPANQQQTQEPATQQPSSEQKPLTLRDQLSSAFKPEEAQQQQQPEQQQQQQQQQVPQLTQDGQGRWRTADGMYASMEAVQAFQQAQQQAQQQQQDPNAQQQAPAFMQYMTPVELEQYHALPAEIRDFFGRTMEAVNGQAARYNEYAQIEQALIGPRREAWAQNGMNPAAALNHLFGLSDYASRDPTGFVLWFADTHKIDLDEALDAREQQMATDPNVRALQGQLASMQQQLTQHQLAQANAAQQANLNDVQTFAQEKDGGGNLKRPYLTHVADTWPVHIQSLKAANPMLSNAEVLQQAYEAACWANPNVRASLQQDAVKKQREEAARKVANAKDAGSLVSGGPAGAGAQNTSGKSDLSVRDELRQQFANAASA